MAKLLMLVCLSSIALFAIADPVSVTTCTNSCVITQNSDGTITIRDCCGGRVTTTITIREK